MPNQKKSNSATNPEAEVISFLTNLYALSQQFAADEQIKSWFSELEKTYPGITKVGKVDAVVVPHKLMSLNLVNQD